MREPGAPAEAGTISLCVPQMTGNEWAYVKECLDTNFVSSVGKFVTRFEREFAARVGASHAVATGTGTAALHVALLVAGVQPGDLVLVSALSFIAPANAIRYCEAMPYFIDVEPEHWQMDPRCIAEFLEDQCERRAGELFHRDTGRRVSAIVPVHILGHPARMGAILELAAQFDLRVVEDATESLGATVDGMPAGTLGDLGCFSFNGNKLITTGGGGMIVTNDAAAAARAKYLSTQAKDDAIEFVHNAVGFNYRLTNVQAAIGVAQMEHLDAFIARKRAIAGTYRRALRHLPGVSLPAEAEWAESACWMNAIRLAPGVAKMDRRALMQRLAAGGVETRPLWQALSESPAHAAAPSGHCVVAETLQRECLCLPSSTGLTDAEQQVVIDRVVDALS